MSDLRTGLRRAGSYTVPFGLSFPLVTAVAEGDGNRTRLPALHRHTRFEDEGAHQAPRPLQVASSVARVLRFEDRGGHQPSFASGPKDSGRGALPYRPEASGMISRPIRASASRSSCRRCWSITRWIPTSA